jgi:NHL repeat
MIRRTVRVVACAAFAASAMPAVSAGAARLPQFEVDPSWPKVPAQLKLGDASSVAIDAKDDVFVLHRPRTLKGADKAKAAPAVIVFDGSGNFVKAWGGDGVGYEWPQREHGIHIDNKGFVWISGNNCPGNGLSYLKPVADDQILKFSQDGKFVMQIGHSNASTGNADTKNVHRAADFWVYPQTNELFVADGYGNHRVIVFDAATGAYKRMWGAFGKAPKDDDHCEIVTPKTFPDPGPDNFSIVHSIKLANDGTVYVADRENRRVQVFTKDGKYLRQIVRAQVPFARDLAFSPDQKFLYVGEGKDIAVLDPKSLEVLGTIAPKGIIGGGHLIAVDSKGNIYIAQTSAGLQKLTYKGMGK